MLKRTRRKSLPALLWLVPQFWLVPQLTLVPQLSLAADAAPKESAFGVYQGYSPILYPDQIKTSFYLPMRDGVAWPLICIARRSASMRPMANFRSYGITPSIEKGFLRPAPMPRTRCPN